MTEAQEQVNAAPLVRKRQVIHFGGFEPVPPETLDRRMASGVERFRGLWGAYASKSPPSLAPDGAVMSWRVEARGPNWQADARYMIFRWDVIIQPYTTGSWPWRMVRGYAALFDYLFTGTIGRFFKHARRYGIFSIYPFVTLVICLLLGWLVAAVLYFSGVPELPAWLIGLAACVALLRWGGNWLYLEFALDHWKFADDLARRRVPGFNLMLDRLADELAAVIRASEDDEIVISGVSLGSVIATETLARALRTNPALLQGRRVALLTTGSSFLQVGLHPAATEHRAAVARVASEAGLFWLEIQTTTDPVNFPDTDPVGDLGLPPTGRPVVRLFRLRDLMTEEGYDKIRYDHMRLHRQYVMPNGQRHYYDYYMICFGPLTLERRAGLAEAALALFGPDGRLLDRGMGDSAALASGMGFG